MAKRFRTTIHHRAGNDAAEIVHGRILNVNMVNWTVDVITQFDRKYYMDVQVSALYLHYNNGEGIYAMPEVGAVVMLCIPSDSSPPYVAGFVAPMQSANATGKLNDPDQAVTTTQQGQQQANEDNVDDQDAPAGTRSRGGKTTNPSTDARFDAGRPMAKPGDIYLRTRDGNFITLHRGGVVEIGATEIAKRIYIPIGNKILDLSENYEHQSVGGSVSWGIQEGPSIQNPPSQHMETFRLYANDKYADLRIAKGKIYNPVSEPAGSAGADAQSTLGFDPIIVYEVVLSVQGFKTVSGDLANASVTKQVSLKFFFDKKGNVFLRSEGSAFFQFAKKVKIVVGDSFELEANSISMTAKNGAVLDGGPSTEIKGEFVRLQGGNLPVARQGDAIQGGVGLGMPTGAPCIIKITAAPIQPGVPLAAFITIPTGVQGSIISGNPNLRG